MKDCLTNIFFAVIKNVSQNYYLQKKLQNNIICKKQTKKYYAGKILCYHKR